MIDRVVVINDDCVESGGAAVVALASARLLRERGVPVCLVSGDDGQNEALTQKGVEIVALGRRHILDGARLQAAWRGLYDRASRSVVEQWITANDTPGTIYHLHNWHKRLSPSIFFALQRVADRVFMTAHDYFLVCPNGGYFNYPSGSVCDLTPMSAACIMSSCDKRHYAHKLWRVARKAVQIPGFRNCLGAATVVAVHDGMVPLLERGGIAAEKIAVVRNPVLPWSATRVEAENNRDIFFVGRLEVDKGVELLARAAQSIGVGIQVIGEGPSRQLLESKYPNAALLGHLHREQISRRIQTARMVVLPTRWPETFGLVALEAAMSGIPVVVSTTAPMSREITELGVGLACDPQLPEALARHIKHLLDDDATVADMSNRGYTRARRLAPTPSEWAENLVRLYQRKLTRSSTLDQ